MDGRARVSRGSVDVHTAHAQPIIGTPIDVPVPRNVTSTGFGLGAERGSAQGMMMRDFSTTPSLLASTYFRRSSYNHASMSCTSSGSRLPWVFC